MKTTENYLAEISEIRKMMEESSRFLSLSGLSGIIIGIYAMAGAFVAYLMIYYPKSGFISIDNEKVLLLILLAGVVLLLSFITTILLTWRRAKKSGVKIWNPGSRLMLINLAIPLITGGILILIFTFRGIYIYVSPACLIFYGLALVNAAKFTRQEIFFMGLIQIALGIFGAIFPSGGLVLWAIGFGIVHIVYGTIMYFRYEHASK
jgi:hypothetical protein